MEDQNNIKNRCENNGCNGGRAFRIRDAMFCSQGVEMNTLTYQKMTRTIGLTKKTKKKTKIGLTKKKKTKKKKKKKIALATNLKKLNWILDDHESTIMEDQNNVDIKIKKK